MENKENKKGRNSLVLEELPSLDQLTGKQLDTLARAAGETFVLDDRIKTHQLRNIFSAIERMRTRYQQDKTYLKEVVDDLYLLKPKLAYAAGRQKTIRYHLFPFMENAIQAVADAEEEGRDKAVRNFFALIESVVGYHKYFENQ